MEVTELFNDGREIMSKELDLNLLEVFFEVYRLRSITLASAALNTTQPAVSSSLKRLSDQIQAQLFVREGRGIAPTQAAIQLATEIGPALNAMYSAVGNLQEFDINQKRTFYVYINEPMLLLLQPLVEQDKEMGNCEICFIITPITQEILLDDLSLQKVDLVIDFGSIQSFSYSVEPFFEDTIKIACAKSHPQVQGSITLETYYQQKHAGIKTRRNQQHAIHTLTKDRLQERKIGVECDSMMPALALAAGSDILTFIPASMVERYAPIFNLQVLDCPFEIAPVIHNMIWHKRNEHSIANQWLRNKLTQLINQYTSLSQ